MSSIDSLNVWKFGPQLVALLKGGITFRRLSLAGWRGSLGVGLEVVLSDLSLLSASWLWAQCNQPLLATIPSPPWQTCLLHCEPRQILPSVSCLCQVFVTAMETVAKTVRLSHDPLKLQFLSPFSWRCHPGLFGCLCCFFFLISNFKEMTWCTASGSFHLQNSLGAALKQISFHLPLLAGLLYHQPASDYGWLPVISHLAPYSDGEDGMIHAKNLLN